MKKNKMMRLASGLLVAVLLTTCAISGTFAKYVTEKSAADSARVAKWGITVTASADGAFATEYDATVKDLKDSANATIIKTVKSSSDDEKLVAPGTSGTLAAFTITGQPEVAVNVTYSITALELTNWKIGEEEYCPIIFNVGSEKYYIGKTNINNVEELINAVKSAVDGYSESYQANTNLSAISSAAPAISWEWEFDGTKTDATLKGYQTDLKDTALGNWINATPAAAPTIDITITCTVTQID